ncbi:hypothetical protein Pla52o_31770 [Novipirellula galeiformis]|uniref:Uncharacterized protein n=1 Tax=Novipirellula galeiformis TaxID=2528004 RepID=A0A5C6CHC4_9BACT|nr:hypothetical protein [Novipirellula galeiformis]TWU22129.1 hypothetical protein Pla52o_31770 [Novipirellula galeiformis]
MSLVQIAQWMIRIRQQDELTPALILPAHLNLRAPFYEALGRSLADAGIRRVRFDVLRPIGGLWQSVANRIFAQQVGRLNRVLARRHDEALWVQVAWTATIARPLRVAENSAAEFVIGVAQSRDSLPTWVASIDLAEPTV